jgi:ABC-type amino acid transport substrate-binding protein
MLNVLIAFLVAAMAVVVGIKFKCVILKCEPNGTVSTSSSPTPTPGGQSGGESATQDCDGQPPQTAVLKRIMDRKAIVMGVQSEAPPMNYEEVDEKTNEKKRLGFDYDMASLIASHLNLIGAEKVRVKEVELYAELPCLLKRKEGDAYSVDVIMSGITPDDIKDVEWSMPYFDFGYALIAKKNSYISNLIDCRNKKIGIVKGDPTVEAYARSKLPNATLVPLDDDTGWMNSINTGDVDAIIYDYPFAVVEVKDINDEKNEAGVTGDVLEIKKAFLEGSDSKYCIGLPAGNPDLKRRIDEAIDTIKGSPQYITLVQRYFRSGDVKKAPVPAGANFVVVKKGDSLSQIAMEHLGNADRWPELQQLNNVGSAYLIFPGQKLIMPADYSGARGGQ